MQKLLLLGLLAALSSCAHISRSSDHEVLMTGAYLENDNGLSVAHLNGHPYRLGYQHGYLLREQIHAQWSHIMRYARAELPVPIINRIYINTKLRRAYRKMKPFISPDHHEEMRGLADGADISLKKVHYAHAIPDLFPTLCSNGAYYGNATENGRLIHLRNLDWSRGMGVHERACVFAVKPDGKTPFVNFGYAGFIGALSGVNANGLSVGQIGCDTIDYTLRGEPMPLLLRRVLEESRHLNDAALKVESAHRTYGYNYIFADAEARRAVALETTANHFAVFTTHDLKESMSGYGLPLEDVLVRSDTAFDPVIRNLQTASGGKPSREGLEMPRGSAYEKRYMLHSTLVKESYGKLNPEKAREIANAIAPGSNIQSIIFAYPDVWVANARDDLRAAETGYHRFHIPDLLDK